MATPFDRSDRMPLLLLPGTLCDDRLFAPLRARLAPRPTLVGDLHGLDGTAALAERLLAAAPARFALLGFSLGAIVALEIAHRAPGRVAGLALVGGNAHPVAAADRAARRLAAAAVADPADHVATRLWPDYAADAHDADLKALLVAMADAAPPDALRRQTEVALTRADARPRLAALAMPALVLAGAADRINPPTSQYVLAAGLPAAELVLVPGAGHFVPLEQPDAVAHAVARWLGRVDGVALPLPTPRIEELT